jgi:lysozyme family protein
MSKAPPGNFRDNFPVALAWVLAHEGGFTNDSADHGGATNRGITRATLASWRGRPVTDDDVRELSFGEAADIYRARYWNLMRCPDLPPGIDLCVFDAGVMSGPARAARFLQAATGVEQDGIIGPHTLAAAWSANPAQIVDAFAAERAAFYDGLGRPQFIHGWLNRTEQTRLRARQMVDAEAPQPVAPKPVPEPAPSPSDPLDDSADDLNELELEWLSGGLALPPFGN